jgi:hypothetical protein
MAMVAAVVVVSTLGACGVASSWSGDGPGERAGAAGRRASCARPRHPLTHQSPESAGVTEVTPGLAEVEEAAALAAVEEVDEMAAATAERQLQQPAC